MKNIIKKYHLKSYGQDEYMPLWHYVCITADTKMNPVNLANELYELGIFQVSQPVFWMKSIECCYDPDFSKQWGLYNSEYYDADISVCGAWGYATGRNIKIAIIDTGVEKNNPDICNNILGDGYDATSNSNGSKLYSSHGTHCAGVACASYNN